MGSCVTYVGIMLAVSESRRGHRDISSEAIENAIRARWAEEGAFLESGSQRYGN